MIRLSTACCPKGRRFLATLTILSVTFTQAVPAWALRPEGGDSLATRSGLEESLNGLPAPVGLLQQSAPQIPPPVVLRGISNQAIASVYHQLGQLPPGRRNTRDMLVAAVEILRAGVEPQKARTIPDRAELERQLGALSEKLPQFDCPTCGARVAQALLADPFVNPERNNPVALQSVDFQDEELFNAALLAISFVQEGKILTQAGADGHRLTASTMADLRDLLTLSLPGTDVDPNGRYVWNGVRLTQGELAQALGKGQVVVAHIGGNHFVRVLDLEGSVVQYTDPQISAATGMPAPGVAGLPSKVFFERWKGDSGLRSTGVALIGYRPGQQAAGKTLSEAEMKGIVGCCGINAIFGHFRGVRKILDAVIRLKYRAPDNTGILVVTREGLVVRKVQGAPDELLLGAHGMMAAPLFPEQLDLPEGTETNRAAIAQYRRDRRQLLIQEGLEHSGWVTLPEDLDPGRLLNDLHNSTIENLYAGNFTVGMGDVGGLFSGWIYTLGRSVDGYQALNGPLLNIQDMVSRWDITPEFLKLFIRYRLMQRLPQEGPAGGLVLGNFDRMADRAMKGTLSQEEQEEWNRIWREYLEGQIIVIPPDFNRDPVRHVFHLLDQMVGSFPYHPEWQARVQANFESHRPSNVPATQWNWREYWEREYRYNMPGRAWAALVDWFEDWARDSGRVPSAVYDRWQQQRRRQIAEKGFSQGTVDAPLLLILPEIILGHGRWAMTGDPKWWNGHPQVTQEHAVVHNGAIEAGKNTELSNYDPNHPERNGEHLRRYMSEMERAAQIRASALGDRTKELEAEEIEQRARLNYGNRETVDGTDQIIRTDTRTVVRHWQMIYDDYLADRAAGRMTPDGLVDTAAPGKLYRPGAITRDGFPVFDRAGAWNRVVQNLRQFAGIVNPNPDEVAHRVAMLELAPGSGIATDGVSLVTPLTEFVTSHDRPVDIVIYQKRDGAGHLMYEDYMVTSDQAAGIGLFPAHEVFTAARALADLEGKATAQVDELLRKKKSRRISEKDFSDEVRRIIRDWQVKKDRIIKGEEVNQPTPDGEKSWFRGGFNVKVYHLKGQEKHAVITRRLDEKGIPVVDVRISKFDGEPLNPEDEGERKMLHPVSATVNPALGDKGRFQSFMEKHIAEIPMILLKQVLAYMQPDASGQLTVDLSTRFKEGAAFSVRQREDGLATRLPEEAKGEIAQHGVNDSVILKQFGTRLEESPASQTQASRIPSLKRIFLIGVGSSWRDAKVAESAFRELLPGIEILADDPVNISNRGIDINPKSDLMVGMSWSGTTDSMVRLFNRLESDGFVTISITGKPDQEMGRTSELSGGTINVLSEDESTVATTKGFESVLYSLSLLAVHLSRLAGDPSLNKTRAEYAQDLKRIADLAYDILNEQHKPPAEQVLDLDVKPGEPLSEVMQLAERYRQRHKLLWVGSRNMPIHVEGELKGEEIVSSKDPDKASMVGIAADIEDSSWQATVTPNYDPNAKEEDKVALGFDMTDPDRFDAFMTEIRILNKAGADFHILTYDEPVNPYYPELESMAAASGGRIRLFVLDSVRPTLEPLISALYYFRFSAALAKTRGLTPEEMDNSRSLAKSVTVSYASRLAEMMRTTKSKVVTIIQQATQQIRQAAQRAVGYLLRVMSPTVWGNITSPRARAIQRLPFVLQRAYEGFFGTGSWLASAADQARLEQTFGEKGRGIHQIVIVTDEEATEFAAEASVDPLTAREVVYPTTKDGKVDKEIYSKGIRVPIKGIYYVLTFDRGSNSYRLRFDPEFQHNAGLPLPKDPDFRITADMREVVVNGFHYKVEPTSFMREKKDANKLAFGLTLRAADPELLGVQSVKVFRASDLALDRELGRPDTLFVLVSRSNNFHQQNVKIPPIAGGIQDTRTPRELAMPELERRPESAVLERARELTQKGGRFVTLSNRDSQVRPFGLEALGSVLLPDDLDDTSLYSVTYMGLLSIGVQLGRLRGISQADSYAEALSTVPGLVSEVLGNPRLRKDVKDFVSNYGNYKKIHIIGGGQAYADAKEYARVLRSLGIFAEAQLNDSAWHGPLAAVDPSREKYADPDARTGINPDFNPRNDTLAIILMTDRRFFDTALGGDAQVYDSRNGRFALVVKKSDANMDAVATGVGASEVFGLADFPDELGNFANAVAAQYLGMEFRRAHEAALGRPILPPVGGQVPPTAGPGAQDQASLVDAVAQDYQRDPGIYMDYKPNIPSVGQTTFVIAAPQGTPGIAVLVMDPLAEMEISVEHAEIQRSGASISVITADLAPDQLQVPRPSFNGRTLLEEIEHRIARREAKREVVPARTLDGLVNGLTARFNPEDPEILTDHYYDPETNRTTFAIIGEAGQTGLLNALVAPLARAGLTVGDHGPWADHADISYVVAKGPVSPAVLSSIAEAVDAITPLHFIRRIKTENSLLTDEQIHQLYSDFQRARQGKAPVVIVSESPYPTPPSAVITVALPDPPDATGREAVMRTIRDSVAAEQRNIRGDIMSFLYRGVRLIQLTVDNREDSSSVRGAATRIETGLAADLEQPSYTVDQAVERIKSQREAFSGGRDQSVIKIIFYMGEGASENPELSILGGWEIKDLVDSVAQRSFDRNHVVIRVAEGKMRVLPAEKPAAGLEEGRTYEIYRNVSWPLPVGTILVHTGSNIRYRVSGVDAKGRLIVTDPQTNRNLGTFNWKDLFPPDQKWVVSPLYRQILPASAGPKAGLEETATTPSPLELPLPDWLPAPKEVLGRIRQALQAGLFLRKIQELREMVASPKTNYRKLSTDEQRALKAQGVTAEDWDRVTVPMQFGAEDIARMRDVTLLGTVRLGLLRGTTVVARDIGGDGTEQEERLPSAIERTALEDVIVGNGVFIKDNTKIRGYVIEEGAAVYDNGLVLTDSGTTFGLGAAIPVGPEVGGREVKAYPEILLGDIARLARSRGDQSFQAEYQKEHDRYVAAARSDYGYIGKGAQLSGSHQIRNLFLSPGAQFMAVPDSRNVIVLSGPEDLIAAGAAADSPQLRAGERTWVVGAQKIENVILQQGVKVASGAVVIGTSPENGVILLEHSYAENMATVKDSVIGPNTGIEKGEVTSSLMGPFIGMHHSSIVIGVDWAEGMGNVGAEAAIGSNHTSRAPDQELRAGEGTFFGLNSSYSFSGNYSEAPYSIFGKGVSALPQRVRMPFSLVERPIMQIHGISPELMQISPGWVWSDNAYMPMRNEGKYASRDRAKRHNLGTGDLQRYPYEILRPSIVNQMIRARDVLKAVDTKTARVARIQVPDKANGGQSIVREVRYYTSDQIPELGKNFMTEETRQKAIKTYSFMIEYYAFKGLLAEVQKRIDTGRITEVAALLETPSADLRWEHERRTLAAEVPGITVTSALQTLVERQGELARRVWQAKDKDDQRGDRMLDDYGKTHISAENDKFVKQSAAAVQKLDRQVKDLVRRLELRIIEEKTGFSMRDVSQLFGDRKPATMTFYPNDGAPEPEATGVAPEDLTVKFQNAAFDVFQNAADARVAKYDVSILEHTDIPNPSPAVQALGGVHFKIVARRSGLEEGVQAPSRVDLGPATRFTGDVALTQTGKPILTVSALKAELTLVPGVSSAKLSSQQVFVVAPDGLAKFAAAVTVFGAGGVTAEIIARNAKHKQQVEAGLRELGLRNFTVHDLETEYAGNLGAAIEDVKIRLWQADQNTQVQVVTALTGLLEVEQFLGAAAAEGTLRAIEAIADRSNQVWS